MCAGRVVTRETSLAALQPALAREWHPTRNGSLRPEDITTGTPRKVWWRCPREPRHVWRASVGKRVHGQGCPHCPRTRITPHTSLRARRPDLAREWHPTKNGLLRPGDVGPMSHRRVWWRCRRDHEWHATVMNRTYHGSGCPVCAGKVASPETSLAALRPTVALEWHPTRNGTLTPVDVRPGSSRRVWWRCRVNRRHEWLARIASRTGRGTGCPFCAGDRRMRGKRLRRTRPL
jgi:hypothetical protein